MGETGTQKEPGKPGREWVKAAGPFLTMGMQLAISVVVFFFIGRWLDGLFDTAPWLTIAGAVLGMTGGFVSFFRTVIAIGKREEREAKERRKDIANREN